MGKSDPYIFSFYSKQLPKINYSSIALLGQSKHNDFTNTIQSPIKDLYDLQLNNWDINSDWSLERKYNLIVCTRCAYFAKDSFAYIKKCLSYLEPGGFLFTDWGYGDHWRFNNFKIGWVKDGEHEYSQYGNVKSYLHSGIWHENFQTSNEFIKFKQNVIAKKYYDNLDNFSGILKNEVPSMIMPEDIKLLGASQQVYDIISLWPDSPQLYISALIRK
jgi:hypothetical protein